MFSNLRAASVSERLFIESREKTEMYCVVIMVDVITRALSDSGFHIAANFLVVTVGSFAIILVVSMEEDSERLELWRLHWFLWTRLRNCVYISC